MTIKARSGVAFIRSGRTRTRYNRTCALPFCKRLRQRSAPVTPEDVMAYIAAVTAHPAFTARFKADLVRPGLRLPLAAGKALFEEAAALGREGGQLARHREGL